MKPEIFLYQLLGTPRLVGGNGSVHPAHHLPSKSRIEIFALQFMPGGVICLHRGPGLVRGLDIRITPGKQIPDSYTCHVMRSHTRNLFTSLIDPINHRAYERLFFFRKLDGSTLLR